MNRKQRPAAKHTPGPWQFDGDSVREPGGSVLLVNGVALPTGNHARDSEATANACLISAAPELLGVCQEILAYFAGTVVDNIPLPLGEDLQAKLMKAVDKAKGRTS